jgi:chorismate mutase
VSEREIPGELAALRASIDNLDAALVYLLAERFRCTQQVGHLKAELGLAPSDPAREEEQLQRLRQLARESGLDPAFAEKVLAFIIAEVIRNHGIIAEAVSS